MQPVSFDDDMEFDRQNEEDALDDMLLNNDDGDQNQDGGLLD